MKTPREIVSAYIKVKVLKTLSSKMAAGLPSGKDRELSLLLKQLETGQITPQEYAVKFRRLWREPATTEHRLMRDPSSGELIITKGWMEYHKKDFEEFGNLERSIESLHDDIFSVFSDVADWEEHRLLGLGVDPEEIIDLKISNVSEALTHKFPQAIWISDDAYERVSLGEEYKQANAWLWQAFPPNSLFPGTMVVGKPLKRYMGNPHYERFHPPEKSPKVDVSSEQAVDDAIQKAVEFSREHLRIFQEGAMVAREALRTFPEWGPQAVEEFSVSIREVPPGG